MLLLVNLGNLRVRKHSKGAGVFGDDIICKTRVGPGLREKTSVVYGLVVGKNSGKKRKSQWCLLSTMISGFTREGNN